MVDKETVIKLSQETKVNITMPLTLQQIEQLGYIPRNTTVWADCLEALKYIADKSVDFLFTDLPYGTTKAKWDTPIDLVAFWSHVKRVLKPNGCVALFAQTPFDKVLGVSNLEMLRYEWVWEKTSATGGMNAKKMPMKAHENILIFYQKSPTYNFQKTFGHVRKVSKAKNRAACIERRNLKDDGLYNKEYADRVEDYDSTERYPRSVLKFKSDKQTLALHDTQKPLELCEYFCKTYSNENELVVDLCAGSCSIGRAAKNLKRDYINIEIQEKFAIIGQARMIPEIGL